MTDLISRQAAIDATVKMFEAWYGGSVLRDREIRARFDALPSALQWTPCGVKLPEEKKAVYWVCNDSGDQFECRWTNANYFWTDLKGEWHWNLFDVPQYSKVVAWMPLPKPYKEESDG